MTIEKGVVQYSIMQKLLIATRSKGKFSEIATILENSSYDIQSLNDTQLLPKDFEVEEPASTLEGNALIKAMTIGMMTGELTAAEDSGLMVDTLDGRPGVRSARYAPGTDTDRCRKLLDELRGVPKEKRKARFKAVVALFDPVTKKVRICEGNCEGEITQELIGENGFGYDPIFRYVETGKTGGEMNKEEKSAISHRGAAWRAAGKLLASDFNQI